MDVEPGREVAEAEVGEEEEEAEEEGVRVLMIEDDQDELGPKSAVGTAVVQSAW